MAEQRNEGEGNRSAARAYDRDQKQFAESGKVEKAARDAAQAIGGKEGESLRLALRGFQETHGLEPTGKIDQPTLHALYPCFVSWLICVRRRMGANSSNRGICQGRLGIGYSRS